MSHAGGSGKLSHPPHPPPRRYKSLLRCPPGLISTLPRITRRPRPHSNFRRRKWGRHRLSSISSNAREADALQTYAPFCSSLSDPASMNSRPSEPLEFSILPATNRRMEQIFTAHGHITLQPKNWITQSRAFGMNVSYYFERDTAGRQTKCHHRRSELSACPPSRPVTSIHLLLRVLMLLAAR